MSGEFIGLKDIGRDRKRKQLKVLGKGVLTISKAFGKGFADTAKSTARAFAGGTQEEQLTRLRGQETKLKLKLKVSRKRAKLARLRKKTGSGFAGFQDFATKVSKTHIARGELGGTVLKRRKKKGRRISMF